LGSSRWPQQVTLEQSSSLKCLPISFSFATPSTEPFMTSDAAHAHAHAHNDQILCEAKSCDMPIGLTMQEVLGPAPRFGV